MKIGVISDTHNYLDPRVPELLAGVDHILHAGDVGLQEIITELERIAPVTAVVGNTDAGLPLRNLEVVELNGRKFLVHHIVDPYAPSARWQEPARKGKVDVIIFGHTHRPYCQKHEDILFFNPGYAGKQRFLLPRSVAILECDKHEIRTRHLPLASSTF